MSFILNLCLGKTPERFSRGAKSDFLFYRRGESSLLSQPNAINLLDCPAEPEADAVETAAR